MKSTDIPNAYVIRGPSGGPVLVEYDDSGKPKSEGRDITIQGWLEMEGSCVMDGILILVHVVMGEEQMLLKRLRTTRLQLHGKNATIAQVARIGQLSNMAEKIRKDFVAELEQKEQSSVVKA
jgi:hypothetical protein